VILNRLFHDLSPRRPAEDGVMLTIDEALRAVLEEAGPLPPRPVPLVDALCCELGEDVAADIDLPPFDKALVDGYAVRSEDLRGPERWLRLGESIMAGQTPTRPLEPGEAALVMTGAPIPAGCNAVVMHERTQAGDGGVRIDEPEVRSGQNILPRGREMRAGEIVLAAGTTLGPAHLGVLASVGCAWPRVVRPRVAVVSTGDELVEPGLAPGPGQIRNSNAVMLRALAVEDKTEAEALPIAPDEPAALREILRRGLESDVLLITGGVSAGQRDLVPETLEALGVRRVFHKVRLKPGKPIWFGIGRIREDRDAGAASDEARRPGPLVFGLPGNPVSGLVGYLLFVRPALDILAHRLPPDPNMPARVMPARLARPFRHRGDRPTYFPARMLIIPGKELPEIETLDWAGSADLRTTAHAQGFAAFPAGDRDYAPGDTIGFLPSWSYHR
jgi:molybdopterin molybdotransferase